MVVQTALSTLLGKVAALGFAAKAAAVTTVAVASIGAAGAAGALPAPLQQQFDKTVNAVTPGSNDSTEPQPSGSPSPKPRPSKSNFGSSVSTDAKDGGVDGQQISQEAKNNGNRPDDAGNPSGLPSQVASHAAHGRPSSAPSHPAEQHTAPTPETSTHGHTTTSKAPGRP